MASDRSFMFVELAACVAGLACRADVTAAAGMSTMPQSFAGPAPPSSNADWDPTIAKESLHASCVFARSVPESVAESLARSVSLRPQMPLGLAWLK